MIFGRHRLSVEAVEYLLAAVGQHKPKETQSVRCDQNEILLSPNLSNVQLYFTTSAYKFNDDGADLPDNDDLHIEDDGEFREHGNAQEGRRQQLLQNFL